MPEVIDRAPATFPAFTKCFQGNIQSYFMTVFETIGDGLGKTVNFYVHAIHPVGFYTIAERRS